MEDARLDLRSSRTAGETLPPAAWLLLALSAVVCVVWFVHARGYWEDDAYIHLEFARSVATGHGFSFNGHVVYGDTSPLWVWLLVATHSLIPDWMAAGKTLTAVAAVFALWGAFVFSRSVTRPLSPAGSSLFAAWMVLVFVANPYFGYWAFSGMEALGAAGLVCWGAAAVSVRPLTPIRLLLGALAAGLAPVLRPEMSFFTLLLGLVLLVRCLQMPASAARRAGLLAAGVVLAAGPAILWGMYALRTFGMVVPNTNAAKRAGPQDSVVLRLLNVYTFGFPVIVAGLVLLAAWLVWTLASGTQSRQSQSSSSRESGQSGPTGALANSLHAGGWLLFVWTAIDAVFYVADHTYVQTRYIFVTAPVLTIALLAIAVQRWPRVYRGLTAFALIFGAVVSALTTWPLIRNKVEVDRVYADLASYLRGLPPDAPVAHYSIGEAAFLSQHSIVDTGGITRPSIIPYLADASDDRRTNWIYAQGARYEVVDHSPTPGAVLVWSRTLPSTGWFLNPKGYRARERLQVWKLPRR